MTRLTAFLSAIALLCAQNGAATNLQDTFADPPREYRPRVWWHWMNGNITHEGIRKDVEWMDRAGLAGFHLFDAGYDVPQIVENRMPFMCGGWKREFNFALDLADSLGFEVTVASSPGWSVTGGPWVSRDDAMKKLVWSETVVGGGRFRDTLPEPPHVAGFYQTMRQYKTDSGRYDYYRDVAVMAVRISPEDLSMAEMDARLSASDGSDCSVLTDGLMDNTLIVNPGAEGYAWVQIELDRPRTIRAWLEGVDNSDKNNFARRIECSDDGVHFRTVVPRDPEAPTLVNIFDMPATTAKYWRFCSSIPGRQLKYGELRLFAATKVNAATEKAGYFASYSIRHFYPTPADAACTDAVIDLTSRYKNGILDWKAPAGRWRIYRFGYSLTGKHNGPATPEATGLEVDKLDADAVQRYYRNYLKMYAEASSGRLGGIISHIMIDSFEARCQNWTADMPAKFLARRGYPLIPWLPALAGEVIQSPEQTERFLFDYRRTIEELIAEAHYDAVDTVLAEYGLKRHTEAHEYIRAYNADGMDVRRNADIPMAAFWMKDFYSSYPCEEADMREAASVAHIYGQNTVAAESFTTNGLENNADGGRRAWTQHPGNLKSAADAAMASGLTRFVIHSNVHQPMEDKFPGLTLGKYGMAFNRQNTWAEEARPWTDYLARSTYLLSQGRFAADVAVFYGETTNAVARFKFERPLVPKGHAYDLVNRTILTDVLDIQGDRLVSGSGMSYRILVIDREVVYVTMETLRRLREIAAAGVVIVGDEPRSWCNLDGDAAEFKALVDDIWHSGRMNVVSASQMEMALSGLRIMPDVEFSNPTGADIRFVHRHLDGGELYWIANINPDFRDLEVSLDVYGLKPVILHADSGKTEEASYRMKDGRTIVTLHMVPDDAQFILFEEETSDTRHFAPVRESSEVMTLDGAWEVSFQAGRGAPECVHLDRLSRLDQSSEPGVKFFSGTATYRKEFEFTPTEGSDYSISLGEVHDMARVILNGTDLGLAWKKPFTLSAGSLKPGRNVLEIKVTNTWHNRIIGDLQPGADKITWTYFNFYKPDSPLLPSGLLGPVKLALTQVTCVSAKFGS